MDPDSALEKRQNRLLVRPERRNPQHRIPSALDGQPLQTSAARQAGDRARPGLRSRAPESAPESPPCRQATPAAPTAPARSLRERYRRSPRAAPAPAPLRPGRDNPRRLHLRQPGNLAQPAHHEHRNPLEPRRKSPDLQAPAPCSAGLPTRAHSRQFSVVSHHWSRRIVQKHLVHNQRKFELAANPRQLLRLPPLGKVSRRIIGMHHHDGPSLRRDRPPQSLQSICQPSSYTSGAALMRTSSSAGQEVEERIAGLRRQNFAARVAKQPEEKTVRLAGARGEHNLAGIEPRRRDPRNTGRQPRAPRASRAAADRNQAPADRSAHPAGKRDN